MPPRSFCRYFRAEISHGEPDRARDNFPKRCYVFLQKKTICLSKSLYCFFLKIVMFPKYVLLKNVCFLNTCHLLSLPQKKLITNQKTHQIENNSKTLLFAKYDIQSKLVKNNLGIAEPKDKEFVDIEAIDIALIPCVAFNDKLFRLGMGGGFYDRTFSKKSSTILIGMAYSFQYENESFQEKHDVKMDYVITQKGILK